MEEFESIDGRVVMVPGQVDAVAPGNHVVDLKTAVIVGDMGGRCPFSPAMLARLTKGGVIPIDVEADTDLLRAEMKALQDNIEGTFRMASEAAGHATESFKKLNHQLRAYQEDALFAIIDESTPWPPRYFDNVKQRFKVHPTSREQRRAEYLAKQTAKGGGKLYRKAMKGGIGKATLR